MLKRSMVFSKTITLDPGEALIVRKNGISGNVVDNGSVKIMNFWDLILSPFKKTESKHSLWIYLHLM